MQFSIGNVQFQGHLGLLRHTPLKHIRCRPNDPPVVPRTLWQQIRLFEIKRTDAPNTGTTTMVWHATNEVTTVPHPTQITTPQTRTQSTIRQIQPPTTNEKINVKQQASNSNASGTSQDKQQESLQLRSKFGSLPKELQLQIFGELPGKDLVKTQEVCKRFDRLSTTVISDGKSNGAREVLKKRREFVQELKEGREFIQERIRRLSHEASSPKLFKINLEKLIAEHRDIGVEMMPGWYFHNPEHIDILLSVLTKQTHLRSLSISEQQVAENEGLMERIISTIGTVSSNCKLTELHVDLASKVTQAQADSLANMPALKSINVGYGSKLGYRTLEALLANPATASIHLTISDKQEGAAEWALVKQALAGNKTLEKMRLSFVADEALAAIAPALEENKSLETLILFKCLPKSHGLQALSAALTHNTGLTTLILQSSYIDDAGVAALAPVLEHNRTLRELNLVNNDFTFQGARALGRSLKHNTTLTKLNLSWNQIGSAGIEAIADAALTMKNLKHLDMTNINGSGGSAMETLRATNLSLSIDLFGN